VPALVTIPPGRIQQRGAASTDYCFDGRPPTPPLPHRLRKQHHDSAARRPSRVDLPDSRGDPAVREWLKAGTANAGEHARPRLSGCGYGADRMTPRSAASTSPIVDGRSLTRSPGSSALGFSRGLSCSSLTMLIPVLAAIDPND
jgi:hypothetical protein